MSTGIENETCTKKEALSRETFLISTQIADMLVTLTLSTPKASLTFKLICH